MRVKGKLVGNIGPVDIKSLIEDGYSEDKFLEYKSELPRKKDNNEKKEFLADVSAFANTEGGVIIYGIKTKKDAEGKDMGIPEKEIDGLKGFNFDAEKLRLESLLREWLTPSLKSVIFQDLKVRNAQLMLLGITKSLFQPHMVWFQKSGKFWRRSNSGKYQMDITEIRQVFLESESWKKAAEQFRQDRIKMVRSGQFIPNVNVEYPFFLHLVPLGGVRNLLDFNAYKELLSKFTPPRFTHACSHRYNLEGYFISHSLEGMYHLYIQIFRDGSVEVYFRHLKEELHVLVFDGFKVEGNVLEFTEALLKLLSDMEVLPPFAVFISALGTMEFFVARRDQYGHLNTAPHFIGRPNLLLPPAIIGEDTATVDQALRPILDMFWQASGWEGSPNFTDDGIWKGRK